MITEFFMDHVLGVIVDFFLALMESVLPMPPGWIDQGTGAIAQVVSIAAQLDNWVPISFAGPVILFMPVILFAGFAIRLIRIILSFATLGGGA